MLEEGAGLLRGRGGTSATPGRAPRCPTAVPSPSWPLCPHPSLLRLPCSRRAKPRRPPQHPPHPGKPLGTHSPSPPFRGFLEVKLALRPRSDSNKSQNIACHGLTPAANTGNHHGDAVVNTSFRANLEPPGFGGQSGQVHTRAAGIENQRTAPPK